jgi:hypothetical protein
MESSPYNQSGIDEMVLLNIRELPVDLWLPRVPKCGVGARKWTAAKKAAIRGERRGMGGMDDDVLWSIDQAYLFLSVAAP